MVEIGDLYHAVIDRTFAPSPDTRSCYFRPPNRGLLPRALILTDIMVAEGEPVELRGGPFTGGLWTEGGSLQLQGNVFGSLEPVPPPASPSPIQADVLPAPSAEDVVIPLSAAAHSWHSATGVVVTQSSALRLHFTGRSQHVRASVTGYFVG